MKHYLITLFIMLLLSGTLVSCATSEERAAQQAETALAVEKALADRHYRIIIQRMNPRRSSMVSLSYGFLPVIRCTKVTAREYTSVR